MKPLVSVIIPVYNSEKYLKEAIESVINQTWQNIEVIVVDDGSTDNSYAIAQSFQSSQIKVIQQTNQGACAARNRGFRESRGEYIQWLDADDYLEPKKVEDQVNVALQHQNAVIYGTWFNFIETNNRVWLGPRNLTKPVNDPLGIHLEGMLAPTVAYLIPRNAINTIGGWDESLTADQDGDLIMRLMLQDIPFVHALGDAGIWRHHGDTNRVSCNRNFNSIYSRYRVCDRVIERLQELNRLDRYSQLLAMKLDRLAQLAILDFPDLALSCLTLARNIAPDYHPKGSFSYQITRKLLGLKGSEKLRHLHSKVKNQLMPSENISSWLTKERLTTIQL